MVIATFFTMPLESGETAPRSWKRITSSKEEESRRCKGAKVVVFIHDVSDAVFSWPIHFQSFEAAGSDYQSRRFKWKDHSRDSKG